MATLQLDERTETVLLHADIDDRAVRLYLLLNYYAREDGIAWPSYERMLWHLNCRYLDVDRALFQLEDVGLVKSTSGADRFVVGVELVSVGAE